MMAFRENQRRQKLIRPGRTSRRLVLLLSLGAAVLILIVLARPHCEGEREPLGTTGEPEDFAATAAAEVPASAATAAAVWTPPRFKAGQPERDAMVRTIHSYGLADKAILAAIATVPRHKFVPESYRDTAHSDRPLPIGYGQPISQPYIVAEMTRQLRLKPTSRVLEIGTGSGYQAAVLSEFTPHVYTIEIIKPLADSAAKRLKRLGYDVVEVRHGDGYYGWKEKAPFDAIIVTCAAGQIPPSLIRQLAPGGRMVIPVGPAFAVQTLMLVTKDPDGRVRSRNLMGVRFVPLRRKDATSK